MNIHISVCLETVCSYQLSFLKSVNQQPELYNPDFLKKVLYRYEAFWLPLAAEHHPQTLAAPLDIEWLWHCHMLSPIAYAEDCKTVVGKLINHCLYPEKQREKNLQKSQNAWQKMYPNQPFEISANDDVKSDFESKISYDLISAALRQKVFFYQVSLPHFNDSRFLKESLSRYKKYLLLKKKNPGAFLVPCYDIDIVWHSHQLHPANYADDTTKLFQRVFNHDDTVNDRSPDSKLSLSDVETRHLWKRTYNENFAIPGAMYRGDPPDGNLYKITKDNLFQVREKVTLLVITNVQVENIPTDKTKFYVVLKLIKNSKPVSTKKLKGPSQEWKGNHLLKSEMSTASKCIVEAILYNRVGVACCGDKVNLGKFSLDLTPDIHFATEAQHFCKKIIINEVTQTALQVTGHFSLPALSGCKFTVKAQLYTKCTMPLNIEEMWGPVPLPKQASEADNCNVAEHLLFNSMQMKEFTCRVVHCMQLHISVIQVYFHDKMAAVAHLIGTDQLPSPKQVAYPDICATLNPQTGERAILIKNHYGDWGIIIGKWAGVKKGVPGVPGTRSKKGVKGIPGSPGHLEVRFFRFARKTWDMVIIPYEKKDYVLRLYPLVANMFNGEISIALDNKEEVAEYLAVAFSVGLLHVLCQPHPSDWRPGTRVNPPRSTTTQEVNYIPSDSMALVIAGGYCVETPSNFHYYKTKKECSSNASACGAACGGYLYTGEIACLGEADAGGCGGCGG